MLVSGEAGIGKTRLITEALAPFRRDGVQVLAGAGDELQGQRPFGVVLGALAEHQPADGEIGRLLRGELTDAERPLGLEARIAERLVRAVREASGAGPVVVVLDDLQWADQSSLLAAKQIASVTATQPVLLVCAHRPYPAGQALLALLLVLDSQGARRIALRSLPAPEVKRLATALAGTPPAGKLVETLAGAAGNPFLVEAIVRLAAHDVAPAPTSATGPGGVPEALRAVVLQGLRFVPQETLSSRPGRAAHSLSPETLRGSRGPVAQHEVAGRSQRKGQRPGARCLTSCSTPPFPAGSLKAANDR